MEVELNVRSVLLNSNPIAIYYNYGGIVVKGSVYQRCEFIIENNHSFLNYTLSVCTLIYSRVDLKISTLCLFISCKMILFHFKKIADLKIRNSPKIPKSVFKLDTLKIEKFWKQIRDQRQKLQHYKQMTVINYTFLKYI